jgi:hypothetical protein
MEPIQAPLVADSVHTQYNNTKVSMESTSVLRRLCHALTFVMLSFDAHTSGWRAPSYI